MPPRMLWAEEAVHSSAIYVCACMRAHTSMSVHPPEVDTESIFHLPSTLFFLRQGISLNLKFTDLLDRLDSKSHPRDPPISASPLFEL